MYVKNEQGERLLVYVTDTGEVIPKNPDASTIGFDMTEVYCPGTVHPKGWSNTKKTDSFI